MDNPPYKPLFPPLPHCEIPSRRCVLCGNGHGKKLLRLGTTDSPDNLATEITEATEAMEEITIDKCKPYHFILCELCVLCS